MPDLCPVDFASASSIAYQRASLTLIAMMFAGCTGDGHEYEGHKHRDAGVEVHVAADAGGFEPNAWEIVNGEQDPFYNERFSDESIECTRADWRREGKNVEVQTNACNYITLRQPVWRSVFVGMTLELSIWWSDLVAAQPANGYIAFQLGEAVLYREVVEIPSDADARSLVVPVEDDISTDEFVYFHVDNHGANAWTLGEVRLGAVE